MNRKIVANNNDFKIMEKRIVKILASGATLALRPEGGGSEVQKTLFSVRSYWMQNLSSKSNFFTELKNNRLVKNGGQEREDRYRAFSTFLI